MRDDTLSRLARRPAIAFAILIALSLFLGLILMRPPNPDGDTIRYLYYARNIHDYGVLSAEASRQIVPPPPGSGHTPLYPAWVAAFMGLDSAFRASAVCVAENWYTRAPCPLDFKLFVAAQLVLAGVFFGAVWLLALRLSGSAPVAWLAAGFALLSKEPLRYANLILTEALLLPLLALFTVFLVIAYQSKQARWMLAAGAALGFAALTRPAYAYLFLATAGALAVGAIVGNRRALISAFTVFVVAYGMVVSPWLLRNKLQFDRFALTSSYDGDILAQRIAYNRMGWGEFGVAFLYWFPDFGDSLAAMLFPRRFYEKLGWETGSYYATVAPELYIQVLAEAGSADAVMPRLLRTEILAHPVKHALVSLPLAWRAVFVAKYWGIAGLLCFAVVLIRWTRRRDFALLLASLPVWFMVAFHAFVSVSIPRYNLALIPLYASALAWAAYAAGCRIGAYRRTRKPDG